MLPRLPQVQLIETETEIIVKIERKSLEPVPPPLPTEPLTTATKLICPVCAYEGKPSMKLPLNLLHIHVKTHYEKLSNEEKLAKAERERDEIARKHAEAIAAKKAFDENFPNMAKPTWADTWRADAENEEFNAASMRATFNQAVRPDAGKIREQTAEDTRRVYTPDRPQAKGFYVDPNAENINNVRKGDLAENLAMLESSYEHLGMDEESMLAAAMRASLADMDKPKTPLRQIVTQPNVRFNSNRSNDRSDFD